VYFTYQTSAVLLVASCMQYTAVNFRVVIFISLHIYENRVTYFNSSMDGTMNIYSVSSISRSLKTVT